MKAKKSSKKNLNHSDNESRDFDSLKGKAVKKDRSSKKRLSIYDEFDDEQLDSDFNLDNSDMYYDE